VTGGEEGGAGLRRLSDAINTARQLTQHHRGKELPSERADEIAGHLRAAQRLVRGKGDSLPTMGNESKDAPTKPQTGTRRYQLWQRSPLCLWCGRVTRIEGRHEDDSATLDHLHRRSQRAGRSLPAVVLACRRCNNHRGEPPAVNTVCPVVKRAA